MRSGGVYHQLFTSQETTKCSGMADIHRLFRLSTEEWPYLLFGLLATAVAGCTQVSFAVIFSEILGVSFTCTYTGLEQSKVHAFHKGHGQRTLNYS
ncbi:hypothetical protein NP493_1916g00011 [Ridgeia piscesae]|uniref:Uncharacterized protein n=1 Tax=Ridgeia piscesae TaxID=27915 RepID=A0AAD9JQF4_RIDPI|nr:hypothetical protein NP493_1916g00011 [Ridgeia piscesae]